MAGTPVRILLARHGETVSNVEGRWQGQTDSPLTDRGLAQARELGRALTDEPIAAVYSSDLGRAFETARQVAAPHGLQVTSDPRLRELDVGEWTGRLGSEIRDEFPELIALWRARPADLQLPGGETLAQAQARALAFVDQVMRRHVSETVVIITHGAVGQCLLIQAMGRPVTDLWLKERIQNCQVSRLEWTPEAGLRLIELCDVRHLVDVGSLTVWRVADARFAGDST
jgi:probable phosphoglycerate mutase